MSRNAKAGVILDKNVKYEIKNNIISFTGPKGTEEYEVPNGFELVNKDNKIFLLNKSDNKAMWGTITSHIKNTMIGVVTGFKKVLELRGVGYKAKVSGSTLELNLGYSHVNKFPIPKEVNIVVEKHDITITGVNKQLVGQVAANIRALRKPNPYKGAGVRYKDEIIILKKVGG